MLTPSLHLRRCSRRNRLSSPMVNSSSGSAPAMRSTSTAVLSCRLVSAKRRCMGRTKAEPSSSASDPAVRRISLASRLKPWGRGSEAVPTPQSTAAASWTNCSVTAALRSSIPASSLDAHRAISRWMLPTKLCPRPLARAAAATITSAASCEYRKSSPPGSGDFHQAQKKINQAF